MWVRGCTCMCKFVWRPEGCVGVILDCSSSQSWSFPIRLVLLDSLLGDLVFNFSFCMSYPPESMWVFGSLNTSLDSFVATALATDPFSQIFFCRGGLLGREGKNTDDDQNCSCFITRCPLRISHAGNLPQYALRYPSTLVTV